MSIGPYRRRRTLLAVLGAMLGVLLLSGCQAILTTDVHVTGASTATVHVSAVFTDEAAASIKANAQTRAQLLGVFSDRTGVAPSYQTGANTVTVGEDLSYAQLAKMSTLTGVSALSLSGSGSRVTLTLQLVPASDLVSAVQKATSSQPDAAALAQTMLKSTRLVTTVRFDGGIRSVSGPHDLIKGGTVTLSREADSAQPGTLVVTGDPHAHHTMLYVGIGVGVLLLGGLVWALRRSGRRLL